MTKLVALELEEHIICWLNNHFANRVQLVVVNGTISDPVPVLSRVPLGTVLVGPLLFLINIDNLPAVVNNHYSNVFLCADDALFQHLTSDTMDYTIVRKLVDH